MGELYSEESDGAGASLYEDAFPRLELAVIE